jgi:uncharacterized protein YkwD
MRFNRLDTHSRPVRSPLILAVAVTALVAAGNASGGTQGAVAAQGVKHVPALEENVLVAINDLRQEHGLVALRLNAQLEAIAREHSLSMAEHGYFKHASVSGSPFWQRVKAKYSQRGGRSCTVGENLVWASPGLSAVHVLELWLRSPAHRKNLLRPVWREIGLGAVHALSAPGVYEGRDATILTADFGVRRRK